MKVFHEMFICHIQVKCFCYEGGAKQDADPVTHCCFSQAVRCNTLYPIHIDYRVISNKLVSMDCLSYLPSLTMTISCRRFEDSSAVTPIDISSKDGVRHHINKDDLILTLLCVVHGNDWGHVDHVRA